MKLIILRAGDTIPEIAAFRGDFPAWIRAGVGAAWPGEWHEIDVRGDSGLPHPGDAAGFIVTGSASSVTERAPWMLRAEENLRVLIDRKAPVFGICFGHQMIAQALGGNVAKNTRGREIGTVDVRIDAPDPLFDGIDGSFAANATHVDSVVQLPEGARHLATTMLEPISAYAIGETTRCVQFHPEFDGDVMRRYILARAHLMKAEGLDAEAAHAGVTDAPKSTALMQNFVRKFVVGK